MRKQECQKGNRASGFSSCGELRRRHEMSDLHVSAWHMPCCRWRHQISRPRCSEYKALRTNEVPNRDYLTVDVVRRKRPDKPHKLSNPIREAAKQKRSGLFRWQENDKILGICVLDKSWCRWTLSEAFQISSAMKSHAS